MAFVSCTCRIGASCISNQTGCHGGQFREFFKRGCFFVLRARARPSCSTSAAMDRRELRII